MPDSDRLYRTSSMGTLVHWVSVRAGLGSTCSGERARVPTPPASAAAAALAASPSTGSSSTSTKPRAVPATAMRGCCALTLVTCEPSSSAANLTPAPLHSITMRSCAAPSHRTQLPPSVREREMDLVMPFQLNSNGAMRSVRLSYTGVNGHTLSTRTRACGIWVTFRARLGDVKSSLRDVMSSPG